MRVLLVEDEESLAFAVSSGLRAEGFSVDAVRTGGEGLSRATDGEYAAIVLDILLPDVNGYEVCASLRERGVWTPILMLTAKNGSTTKPRRSTPGRTISCRSRFPTSCWWRA